VIPLKDDTPVQTPPIVTIGLIAANIAAFVWQIFVEGLERSVLRGGAIPSEILTFTDTGMRAILPPPFTILTSMFLHGSLFHIGGNMLFLWIFGNNVEDALGKTRFLFFYVTAGVFAALTQTAATVFMGAPNLPMVGASGAVAGVLAGYLILYPRARVLTLIFIVFYIRLVYIPAYVFIGLWFLFQVLSALFGGGGGGVAVFAHIGGFVAGFALVKTMGRRSTWRPRRPLPG
jgi:membrane associated rhomboid family serine protease